MEEYERHTNHGTDWKKQTLSILSGPFYGSAVLGILIQHRTRTTPQIEVPPPEAPAHPDSITDTYTNPDFS